VCAKTCIKDAARYGFVDEEKREEREEKERPCLADLFFFFSTLSIRGIFYGHLCEWWTNKQFTKFAKETKILVTI